MRSDEKEIPSSSGSFLAGAMDYTSSNKTERKEHKGILATCGIWKGVPQQNGKFIGTGSLIKDFFPNCDKKKLIWSQATRLFHLMLYVSTLCISRYQKTKKKNRRN